VADTPELQDLHTSVAKAVRRAGVKLASRRFVPHVTLARFRGQEGTGPDLARFIKANAGLSLPPEPVTRFTLYASTLRPGGARHEVLAEYPLM
jgi:2'-5' RNA ligase